MRLFVGVTLGADVEAAVGDALPELAALAPRARWVQPGRLHVTLAFLGDTEAARVPGLTAALEAVAARHAPVALACAGGGTFGAPARPRVLWAGLSGDTAALQALQADVVAQLAPLGFAPERRAFSAHLTLARAREPRGDAGLRAAAEALQGRALGAGVCEAVVLFESRGGAYVPLAAPRLATR